MALDTAKKRMAGILDVMLMPDGLLLGSDFWSMLGEYDFFGVAGVSPEDAIYFTLRIARNRGVESFISQGQQVVVRVA